MSGPPPAVLSHSYIQRLIRALESLTDGDLAVDLLAGCGPPAIPPLKQFLLHGEPGTISLPRCRAVRALGELQAREVLAAYFERETLPADPVVLFAEDAVRSAAARELLRWKSEETFGILLKAANQRATMGLVEALGEFRRSEAIPFLFEALEDDLCRNSAFAALSAMPDESLAYAILSLRGETGANLAVPAGSRRRRATAELIRRLGIPADDWKDISRLLADDDATVVICAAAIGFQVVPREEYPSLVRALLQIAPKLNWLQEDEVIHLLDDHKALAQAAAKERIAGLRARGERVNWLSPMWRILGHLESVKTGPKGAGQDAGAVKRP